MKLKHLRGKAGITGLALCAASAILLAAAFYFIKNDNADGNGVQTGKDALHKDTADEGVFEHPGVLHTSESIAYMKYAVDNKISPNYETYLELTASPLSSPDWQPRAMETVIRGGDGDNVSRLYVDVARAYQCALIWRISGSSEHGRTAAAVLNSWSSKLKEIKGNGDRYLAAGLFGYQLANVSELMREHPDFDDEQMKTMLLDVFYYPLNERFLYGNGYGADHNDAYISNYWANWDLCNIASAIATGIFCDRQDIYDRAIYYYRNGLGNGSLYNAIPYVYDDGTAQWQEAGRDQAHTKLGLGLMACICEMAWSQGDDLYGLSDNRLLKAAEYIAKYNSGGEVMFSEYEWGSGTKGDVMRHYEISDAGRAERRPIWSMIYNHYVGRMGLTAPNVKKYLDIQGCEYGAAAGGHAATYDQPGWGTLTFAEGDVTHTGVVKDASDAGAVKNASDAGAVKDASDGGVAKDASDGVAVKGAAVTGVVKNASDGVAVKGAAVTGVVKNASGGGAVKGAVNAGVVKGTAYAGDVREGVYRIVSVYSGKALTVNEKGELCQREKSEDRGQQWQLTYIGGGEYKVENVSTGDAISVDAGSYANGAVLTAESYSGKTGQRFAFLTDGEEETVYRIIASNSGKAVDIKDRETGDNAVIIQWRYVQGDNQRWYLERILS